MAYKLRITGNVHENLLKNERNDKMCKPAKVKLRLQQTWGILPGSDSRVT